METQSLLTPIDFKQPEHPPKSTQNKKQKYSIYFEWKVVFTKGTYVV